jgi:hypothetical protein
VSAPWNFLLSNTSKRWKKLCEKWNLCLMRWNMCRRRRCHYVQCGDEKNDNKINVHGLERFLGSSSTRHNNPHTIELCDDEWAKEKFPGSAVSSRTFKRSWKEMKNEEENGQSVVREWNIYGAVGFGCPTFMP